MVTLAAGFCALATTGCNTAPANRGAELSLQDAVRNTIADSQRKDDSLTTFYNGSYGYVVFPDCGSGAFIVGGAYGRGIVFKGKDPVGYADMTQGSIGFQIGGSSFDEIIFFENEKTYNAFVASQWAPSAAASATAITAGAAAAAGYAEGVAIFVIDTKGLMASAAIGAQRFNFESATFQ